MTHKLKVLRGGAGKSYSFPTLSRNTLTKTATVQLIQAKAQDNYLATNASFIICITSKIPYSENY